MKAIRAKMSQARNEEKAEVRSESAGVDMLSRWYVAKGSEPSEEEMKDLLVNPSSNIFAGSDTTAIALRSVIYNLCRNPSVKAVLLSELDAADAPGKLSSPASFKETQTHLPYFCAVLKEAMRMRPAVGLILERYVPPEGVELCGHYLPGGTIVGIDPWVPNHGPDIFKRPEAFEPERWLEGGEDDTGLKERESILMFNFGTGARTCIGKNISMMEMHKVLPELFTRYTSELTHPRKEWEVTNHFFVQQKDMFGTLSLR